VSKIPPVETEQARRQRINDQADKIAELIGDDPNNIACNFPYGVQLHPNQMDKLLALIKPDNGYQNAIDVLKANGEMCNAPGPDHNLTQWAVMVSAASFLEGVR